MPPKRKVESGGEARRRRVEAQVAKRMNRPEMQAKLQKRRRQIIGELKKDLQIANENAREFDIVVSQEFRFLKNNFGLDRQEVEALIKNNVAGKVKREVYVPYEELSGEHGSRILIRIQALIEQYFRATRRYDVDTMSVAGSLQRLMSYRAKAKQMKGKAIKLEGELAGWKKYLDKV